MGLIAKFSIKIFEICAPARNINSPQFSKVKGVFWIGAAAEMKLYFYNI